MYWREISEESRGAVPRSPVADIVLRRLRSDHKETPMSPRGLYQGQLGILALAEELQNISLAYKRVGITRSHFYWINGTFETYGTAPLGAPNEPVAADDERNAGELPTV
jgi:hypothetical protein